MCGSLVNSLIPYRFTVTREEFSKNKEKSMKCQSWFLFLRYLRGLLLGNIFALSSKRSCLLMDLYSEDYILDYTVLRIFFITHICASHSTYVVIVNKIIIRSF